MIIDFNDPDDPIPSNGGVSNSDNSDSSKADNTGTLILDATCAPQNIKNPQDVNLLNEARENLKDMVDYLCAKFEYYTPRVYRKNARKDYLNRVKSKKRTTKKIRIAIKQQLQYTRRDQGYIEEFLQKAVS